MSWTAETNIKGPKGDTGGIGEAPTDGQTYGRKNSAWNVVVSGGGAASSITFTPAGNIAATNVQAAIAEVDTEKVAKAGDTMTGNLQINKANPSLVLQKLAAGQANQLAGYNGANPRWSLALGDSSAEGGSNAGSNFALYRYTDAGGLIDTPLTIARTNGGVTLTGALTLPADPTVALQAATKQYVDNNIRVPATVAPIIDGVAAVGVATKYAREDHVHPSEVAARAVRFDTAQTLTAAQQTQARGNIGVAVMRSYLAGLGIAPNSPSTNFYTVAPGVAADSGNSDFMVLSSALNKSIGAWTLGSGGGGLDTSGTVTLSTWYHVFLIKRPDTGVVDVCHSLSATAPTLGVSIPAAYTLSRRIGSIRIGPSAMLTYVQFGDKFLWNPIVVDYNAAGLSAGVTGPIGLTVPPGVIVTAQFYSSIVSAAGVIIVAFASPSVTLAGANNPTGNISLITAGVNMNTAGQFSIETSTGSAIQMSSSANGSLYVATQGWIDRRGRDL